MSEGVILQFMRVGCWAGITYLRFTLLTSLQKGETVVHCCNPALSVLFMLVRNVFHVVSALQSIVCHVKVNWGWPSMRVGEARTATLLHKSSAPLHCLPAINDVILFPALNVSQSGFTRNYCCLLAAWKRKSAMFKNRKHVPCIEFSDLLPYSLSIPRLC